MTQIFARDFQRTLDSLVEDYSGGPARYLRAWTYDDRKSRRAAEQRLAAAGIDVKLRSAYKPLLHFFLEEVDIAALKSAEIAYPVHRQAPRNRFRLEAYPLAALLPGGRIAFRERADEGLFYDVALTWTDGTVETRRVLAPNRVHHDIIGETNLSPTGWVITSQGDSGTRLETDYEALFSAAMSAIAGHEWGDTEPYFEELDIRVEFPAEDEPLAHGEEAVSLREALHEDFYFSLLEVFQKKSGRPLGDRGLRPGQIVPRILKSTGAVSVRVETRPFAATDATEPVQYLDTAQSPLSMKQVAMELAAIGGEPFEAVSRANRTVAARHVAGAGAAMMISGGQHANETTGVVGALRAARRLAQRKEAHFTVSPLENPDGYALHQRLRLDNPRHMHHAARYTALGDDLEYRTLQNAGDALNEKRIRFEAAERSGALLHVNLHGYPSHEWTRPLSGYVPRNFAMWTLPKGFFLIVRHRAGWDVQAEELLDRVTRHLAGIPGLLPYNDAQIALFETHAGETGFRIINGFPCFCGADDRHDVPLTLITEYPDETIYGDAFVAGHTAQMETVLAAYDALQAILAAELPSA